MADALLTANQVVRQLSELGRELDTSVKILKELEIEAVQKRHAADIAESKAFVNATGAMELRKHVARLAAGQLEEQALLAEALLRHMRTRIRGIDTRIEIGRSYGAAVRAELKTLSYGETA